MYRFVNCGPTVEGIIDVHYALLNQAVLMRLKMPNSCEIVKEDAGLYGGIHNTTCKTTMDPPRKHPPPAFFPNDRGHSG